MHYINGFILFILLCTNAQAIDISVTSSLSFDLTSNAPTEAGTYFNTFYESTSNATLIDIDAANESEYWAVFIRQNTLINGLELLIKRTGEGIGRGKGKIKGGTTYLSLKSGDWVCFFSGKGQREQIPIQTELNGIGVSDNYGEFNTNFTYKVETHDKNKDAPC